MSRLVATSSNLGMHLTLDYNIELYQLRVDDKFTLVLASSLARGGATDATEGKDVWRPDGKGQQGLEEDYEYVMYGKVALLLSALCYHPNFPQIYKFDEGQAENV